nr:uncharacterized protein LOC127304057 [Lolium perenne]
MLHHTHRPPPYATTALQAPPPSHHDQRTGVITNKTSHPGARDSTTAATPEGTASTATCGRRPDASTRSHRAHQAQPSPSGLVKIRSPCCSVRAAGSAIPHSGRPSVRHEDHRWVGSRPTRTQIEPKGPRSGPVRRCPEPPRRPVAKGPCHRLVATRRRAARGDAPPPEPPPAREHRRLPASPRLGEERAG